ncbi:hypothetical protein CK203_052395 [Vitis vinifera]|uniref:Transposase Tnp1/En/Spm-like domain-containing protein n=1 Tax=Vitis vinifera TaxID=29760 RepID=A0A438H6X9_VITVI|nr:hypothetical protein CK203_052395 [Vitis vinifera]
METKEGEKPIKRKYKGMTRKHMIIKNRSKGVKLPVKYNLDGIFIRESAVHLTSYLGVLARTMVPIRYKNWHVVPKQLKNKLWDSIETAFSLNHKSRRNCMLTMGKCFRSFKNLLTVKYILPFEDQPKLLKRPPIQYTFIEDEDWTIFVKDRLSDNFKEYREIQKERRKRNIYNHHLSRKGYAGLEEEMMVASGSTETIDRSILWKKAREKKRTAPLMKWPYQAKGKHYTPHQYFNSAADHAVRDFIATSKEEQRIFQAEVLAKLSQVGAVTPQSDVSSSKMKQKQLLLPEAMDKPIHKVEDVTPPEAIEPQKKVRKCELAIGTKESIVVGGTIILECGPNYLVVVDAPYDSSAPLPIPIPGQATTVGAAIGYQVLWPTDLVIIRTPILASKKAKKQKVNEVEVKSKDDVFGESFKTFMMKEDMEMIISSKEVSSNCILYYIWHLHRKLIDAKQAERYVFFNPTLVSKAGIGEGSKEKQFPWVLVALEMKKMIAYYLDPMACQPCDDLKDIVNMQ